MSPMAAGIKRQRPAASALLLQLKRVLCTLAEGHDSLDGSGKGLTAVSWKSRPTSAFRIPVDSNGLGTHVQKPALAATSLLALLLSTDRCSEHSSQSRA